MTRGCVKAKEERTAEAPNPDKTKWWVTGALRDQVLQDGNSIKSASGIKAPPQLQAPKHEKVQHELKGKVLLNIASLS